MRLAATAGEKAEVADLHETAGQHMEKEAADELDRFQSHSCWLACLGIVLPAESNLSIVQSEQPLIGDGHVMGLARQVLQDLARSSKGWFRIDYPLAASNLA